MKIQDAIGGGANEFDRLALLRDPCGGESDEEGGGAIGSDERTFKPTFRDVFWEGKWGLGQGREDFAGGLDLSDQWWR
jgi:hypothetical protein